MTLRASKQSQDNGLLRQEGVRQMLLRRHHPSWMNSRDSLDPADGNVNLQEKVKGDLENRVLGLSIEVQTSEKPSENVEWKKSKYRLCKAEWQCFVYELPSDKGILLTLLIKTEKLKELLGPIDDIGWTVYERDSSVLLYYDWLKKNGAITLHEWIGLHGGGL